MRVAILTPTLYSYSGIDRVVEQQSEELLRDKNLVEIFTFDAKIFPKKVKVHVLGMPKSLFWQRVYRLFFFIDLLKIYKVTSILKKFDVIYSHQYPMNWLAFLSKLRFGNKYVYYDYGIAYPWLFPSLLERIYMSMFIFFNKVSLLNVDEAISISKFLRDELYRQVGIKSKVKYLTLNKKRFPRKIDQKWLQEKYNLHNKKVILFVGRISPHKRIDLLITAFEKIYQKRRDLVLLIVGKPTHLQYFNYLKRISRNLKDIIFTGEVSDDDLPKYYAGCSVYVSPSFWEGFNLPIVEAQYYGKPVVAFNIGSHPEIIGKNGYLAKPGDTNDLSNKILLALRR